MYLVSLYFDEQTNMKLLKLMKGVAAKTGNAYMFDRNILPHLTIGTIEEPDDVGKMIGEIEEIVHRWRGCEIDFVAIGCFKPHVLYVSPILNEEIHKMSVEINAVFDNPNSKYRPFAWIPHVTMGRNLSEEQLVAGFRNLQANFEPFRGKVVKIGLAKSNPHTNVAIWNLT